jgi:hypothetical protein
MLPQLHKRPKLDPTAGAGRAARKAFPQGSRSSPLSFNVTPADVLVTTVDAPEIFPVRIFYNPGVACGGWRSVWALNPIKPFEELARIASRETNTLCIRVWILRTRFSLLRPNVMDVLNLCFLVYKIQYSMRDAVRRYSWEGHTLKRKGATVNITSPISGRVRRPHWLDGYIDKACLQWLLMSAVRRAKMATVIGGSALFELHLRAERLYCIGGAKADGDWTERSTPKIFPRGRRP